MAASAFTASIPFVLRWEGGYVNHPKDPGGATNKGVTQKVYDACCDLGTAISRCCDVREAYYRGLAERNPDLKVFMKGWMNRLNALRKEVGLPGYEAAVPLDFGDTGYIAKVPDLGEDRAYDL